MKRAFLFVLSFIALVSCSSPRKEAETLDKKYKEYFKNRKSVDISKAHQLDQEYKSYFAKYPGDSSIPALLYQDAQLNVSCLQNNSEALKMLDKILSDYPNHRRIPEVLFFEGFIYDNNLKDTAKAIEKYNRISKDFPKHPLAPQADFCIRSLRPGSEIKNIQ